MALRQAGVASAPAYRLAISLSADWHDPGKTRYPAPGKASHFLQVRDPNRYPIVSDARLVSHGVPGWQRERFGVPYAAPTGEASHLVWLVGQGFVEEVRLPDRRRILPGSKWAGWEGGILGDAESA